MHYINLLLILTLTTVLLCILEESILHCHELVFVCNYCEFV